MRWRTRVGTRATRPRAARREGVWRTDFSRFAHQALRPEPQQRDEQAVDHDVFVDGAEPVGRHRLDQADDEPGIERAEDAAEAAERYDDECDQPKGFAD